MEGTPNVVWIRRTGPFAERTPPRDEAHETERQAYDDELDLIARSDESDETAAQ
jgi:hypothetical protein